MEKTSLNISYLKPAPTGIYRCLFLLKIFKENKEKTDVYEAIKDYKTDYQSRE